jgi:putative hydrolase of HD superfamily
MHLSPAELIQAQLDAYNRKDVDALLATYSPDAEHFLLHGDLLAKGHEQLRPRFLARFSEPDLYAELRSRTVFGNIVIDCEIVTRNFPEGRGSVEMLCIYEVDGGLIRRASFALGPQRLD